MIGRISSKTTALFICDIQTSFLKTVTQIEELIINNKSLMDSCLEFKIPIIMTQHDKNLFGEIVEPLRYSSSSSSSLSNVMVFDKIAYSMYTKELAQYVKENLPNLKSVILTGLESHVCVLQTALDLLENGYEVHVIDDATTSVQPKEYKSSLKRMKQSGVFLTSTETVIYQILQSDNHPKFKKIDELIVKRLFQINNINK
uniref:Isochorismatase family protein 2A n=1 Tax=Dictyostelium discoideum TaxID=44689 RepID=ISC2A_DICDI|nr:RecName: Full=Isochorismatase family protein 2A [Dictyostelium discoideum]